MDKDGFWKLIDKAREDAGGWHNSHEPLVTTLSNLADDELFKWAKIFDEYMDNAYKGGLWGVANLIQNGYCSDDGFIDFRSWLIAQGKDIYLQALADPNSLADVEQVKTFFNSVKQMNYNNREIFMSKELPCYEFFGYSASLAHEKKYGNNKTKDFYKGIGNYSLSADEKQSILADVKYHEIMGIDFSKIGAIGGHPVDKLYPDIDNAVHKMFVLEVNQDEYTDALVNGAIKDREYHDYKGFSNITFNELSNHKQFNYSFFSNCTFKDVDINNARFTKSRFTDCKFENVNLSESSFVSANIENTQFDNCNLNDAYFMATSFKNSRIDNSSLDKANFISAKMDNMQFSKINADTICSFHTVDITSKGATAQEILNCKKEIYKALNLDSRGVSKEPIKKSVKEQILEYSQSKEKENNKQTKPSKKQNRDMEI